MKCEDCPYAIPCYGDKLSGDNKKFSYCPTCRKCVLYERKMLTPEEIADESFILNPSFLTTVGDEKSNEQYGAIWAEGEYIDCEPRHSLTDAYMTAVGGPAFKPETWPKVWSTEVLDRFKNIRLQMRDPGPGTHPIEARLCDTCLKRVHAVHMDLEITLKKPLEFVDIQLDPPKGVDVETWAQACQKGLEAIAKQIEEEEAND